MNESCSSTTCPLKNNRKHFFFIIFIILMAWGVFFYSKYRKVDITLNTIYQAPPSMQNVDAINMTLLDKDNSTSAEIAITTISPKNNIKSHKLSLKPGDYKAHIFLSFPNRNNVFIEKKMTIPEHDATLDLFIRP